MVLGLNLKGSTHSLTLYIVWVNRSIRLIKMNIIKIKMNRRWDLEILLISTGRTLFSNNAKTTYFKTEEILKTWIILMTMRQKNSQEKFKVKFLHFATNLIPYSLYLMSQFRFPKNCQKTGIALQIML